MTWVNTIRTEFRSTFRNDYNYARILEDDGSGSIEKDPPQNEPLKLTIKAPDETLEAPIRGSEMVMQMFADTDYEFMNLFTASGRQFQLRHQLNSGYIWYGWLTPELYSEPHQPAEYTVAIHATDGIGNLKRFDWVDDDGQLFTGKKQILQTLLDILDKLDYSAQCRVYDSAYIYETHHSSTQETDSPLKQTYFNAERLRNSDGSPWNCYEVLEALLRRFHLTLRHYDAYYHIIQINAQKDAYYVRRLYQMDGTLDGYHNMDPHTDVTDSDEADATFLGWVDEWAKTTITPAWKKLVIKQDYGLDDDLLNESFYYGGNYPNNGDPYERYDENSKILYMRATWTQGFDRFIYSNLGDITKATQFLNVKLVIDALKYHNAYIRIYIIKSDSHVYYLDDSGQWHKDIQRQCWDSNQHENTGIEFVSETLPASGTLYISFHFNQPTIRPDYIGARFSVSIGESLIQLNDYDNIFAEKAEITTEVDLTNNHVEEFESLLGDLPNYTNNKAIYTGGLYYYSGGHYYPTASWFRKRPGAIGTTGTLNDIVADELVANHITPALKREGILMGSLNALNIINEGGVKFMVIRNETDWGEDTHRIILLQLSGSLSDGSFLQLKSGGYLQLKGGGKIKLKGRSQ